MPLENALYCGLDDDSLHVNLYGTVRTLSLYIDVYCLGFLTFLVLDLETRYQPHGVLFFVCIKRLHS